MTRPEFPGPPTLPAAAPGQGYYGIPVIHRPHWEWLITGYFFLGGVSGASAVIAAIGRLCGGVHFSSIARIGTYVSFLTLAPCPPLLILDLGRPGRFLNMLRVFRASSPMSVGTWGLAAFGIVSGLSTSLQVAHDLERGHMGFRALSQGRTGGAVALLSGLSGFFVAGYTGILLAATAVPLWSKRPAFLGPLFLSSAMTSGAAAISVVAAVLGSESHTSDERLRALETIAAVSEGSLLVGWIIALGPTARPLTEGRIGMIVRHGTVGSGLALPLLMSAVRNHLPRRLGRPADLVSSALTLAGVLALRYAVVEGGRQSADDPQATFELTG